jgi:DNA-binding CsgD family transcriptional regulator
VLDVLVLGTMIARIGDLGFTPNRAAALGLNLVLLVNLAGAAWLSVRFLTGRSRLHRLERWQTTYLPVLAPVGRRSRRRAPAAVRLRLIAGETRHTPVMATGLAVGGDVEQALVGVGVPSYVLDTTGIVRWINPAAERLLGDIRGRHFTSVVAPEDGPRARDLFTRKVLGTSPSTDATGVLVSASGTRVPVDLSSVALKSGERVVGVFGLLDERPAEQAAAPLPHLTPRQVEVLRLLEQGRSTKQIAAELHLSTETVRNHIRRLFRALGVNSRLEAVAAARTARPR